MGWNWRKRLNFGPARINLSKKGIGYSLGVPGFRMGQDAKGKRYKQISIPGTGIYKRDYSRTLPGSRKWILPLLVGIICALFLIGYLLR
jgi:hypothetical protein